MTTPVATEAERRPRSVACTSGPIVARTTAHHEPIAPTAFDFVRVTVVRSGSAILLSEFGQKPVNIGDVALFGANTLCGIEPENHITMTAIYLDADYVVD